MKRIYDIHHYLGTFFFSLFLIWFLSGFVMMYKSFPFLAEEERIAHQETFGSNLAFKHPSIVYPKLKKEPVSSFKVNRIDGQLVYHLETTSGLQTSRYANSGQVIQMDTVLARRIALQATSITQNSRVEVLHEVDQWIPRPKYIKHLPVYKIQFSNPDKTWVHISSLTGEVLNITTSNDRLWAWLGAIPHWIYFKDIRIHGNFWSQLIMWLAGLGLLMSLTGIITGLARYKKKPKAKFKRFKNKWYNIHYYTGLGFGLFVCTWVFSGFMSMTPFSWVPSSSLSEKETQIWQGKDFTLEGISTKEWNKLNSFISEDSKELSFSIFNHSLFIQDHQQKNSPKYNLTNPLCQTISQDFKDKINAFNSSNPITKIGLLQEYDNYYYDRKNKKALPVLKIDTKNNISYYIDPAKHLVVKKSGTKNRVERWIYHGLHSLDFSFLTNNRPLWDIIVIFLLLGGTFICITATGLGIKFIKRKCKKQYKKLFKN